MLTVVGADRPVIIGQVAGRVVFALLHPKGSGDVLVQHLDIEATYSVSVRLPSRS